jgi:hypothetical protein
MSTRMNGSLNRSLMQSHDKMRAALFNQPVTPMDAATVEYRAGKEAHKRGVQLEDVEGMSADWRRGWWSQEQPED